jgi:hypothetical protein
MLIQAGVTALIRSAGGGHLSVVTLLLDSKAFVDRADHVQHYFCESS